MPDRYAEVPVISDACWEEVHQFKIQRSSNINANVPLGKDQLEYIAGTTLQCLNSGLHVQIVAHMSEMRPHSLLLQWLQAAAGAEACCINASTGHPNTLRLCPLAPAVF